ncbi:MAG: homoserine kinase [Candidatus Obscuribacterales bacterium]|nr:homoserine kinase [Candidatus Obscuribacterales bacterium]
MSINRTIVKKRLKVRVPGSSGNLGPGFDTLALSLKVFCRLTLEVDPAFSEGPVVSLGGTYTQGLSKDSNNLVLKLVLEFLEARERSDIAKHLKLHIENDIPLARGLGSSSAAGIAAIWGAQWLVDEDPDLDLCIQAISQLEGHAENSAASAAGGMVTVSRSRIGSWEYLSTPWPESWSLIVVVPPYEVSTPVARKVLPRSIGVSQAVVNIQNTAMVLSAVMSEDSYLLKTSIFDTIHEPFREALVPELPQLKMALRNGPALGVVLSGAGSSILVITEKHHAEEVLSSIEKWQANTGDQSVILKPEADHDGLVIEID